MSGEHINYVVEALSLRLDALNNEIEYELREAQVHQTYARKSLDKIAFFGNVRQELLDAIEREKKAT